MSTEWKLTVFSHVFLIFICFTMRISLHGMIHLTFIAKMIFTESEIAEGSNESDSESEYSVSMPAHSMVHSSSSSSLQVDAILKDLEKVAGELEACLKLLTGNNPLWRETKHDTIRRCKIFSKNELISIIFLMKIRTDYKFFFLHTFSNP